MDEEQKRILENRDPLTSTEVANAPRGLRTFSSDMAEAVRSGEATVVKIAMAEQKKQQKEYENFSPKSGKNKAFIVGGIIMLALGVGAFGYIAFTRTSKTPSAVPDTTATTSLIFANTNKGFDVTGFTKDKLSTAIKNESGKAVLENGAIENIYFLENGTTGRQLVTAQRFFTILGTSIPGRLSRALSGEFMLGIHKTTTNHPFILVTSTDYDSAYAGLLEWEKKMVDDFFLTFSISIGGDKAYLISKSFQDTTIQNIDARILLDNSGSTVLLYAFLNPKTIVITDNEATFKEVLARLAVGTVKR